MGHAISEVLPFAIGVAISPVPIIAVILVLFSARANANGPAFLVGWVLGVAIVSVAVYLLADAGNASETDSGGSDTTFWIKLVVGILLVLLGIRNWRTQSDDVEKKPPKWMASIDSLTPVKAGGLALLLLLLPTIAFASVLVSGNAPSIPSSGEPALFVTMSRYASGVPTVRTAVMVHVRFPCAACDSGLMRIDLMLVCARGVN